MARIIGPSAAGVTTPADVVAGMQGVSPRDGLMPGSSRVPSDSNMSNVDKVKFLKTWGWAIGDKWDSRAKAAWNNYKAARARSIPLSNAAEYWSRTSRFSRTHGVKPKAKPAAEAPAPVTTASNPAMDAYNQYLAGGQTLSAAAIAGLQRDAAALARAIPNGQRITAAQLNAGLKPYSPSLLDDMAGTSTYDATIKSVQDAIAQSRLDTDANVKQIGGWYDKIGQLIGTAATRDKAIQAASLGSVTDSARAIASAIGGEANPGASMAAQAGAQGAGLVSAMGAANDEFNSDIGPLIAAEGVSRQSAERAAGSDRVSQLVQQIAQIRGEQSQGMGDARLKLAQMNNDVAQQRAQNLLTATQYNSGLDQTRFQNLNSVAAQRAQLAGMGIDAYGKFGPAAPDAPSKPPAKPAGQKPISGASAAQADLRAGQAVDALRVQGGLNVAAGVRAVNAVYGITSKSPRELREQAFRSAVRAMPNVPPAVLRKFYSLG